MTSKTKLKFREATHIGHVRRVNEDSLVSLPDMGIFVVSDGMGGHDGGDFASQTIVETVSNITRDTSSENKVGALKSALNEAHEKILSETVRRGEDCIGATVVSLVLLDQSFVCLWSGDSRLYRYRNDKIELLTHDHSFVAQFVEAGLISWDEAEQHPQSNLITHAVGIDDHLHLEFIEGDLQPGDRFLLCSDGLNKYAGFETLSDILNRTDIDESTDELMKYALDGGGEDNISLIVLDF